MSFVSITHTLSPDSWSWDCICGATGRGYATERAAKESGEAHQLRMHGLARSTPGQRAQWADEMHRAYHLGNDCAVAYPRQVRYGPVTIEQECPFPVIARFILARLYA